MSQIFKENKVLPVTLIEAGPCFVTQIKTKEKDGYEAVQIGFEKLKPKKLKKPEKRKPFRYLREFRVNESGIKNNESGIKNYELGQKIDVSIFKEGDKLKISGVSKGKGFQGVVKKWGFAGRDATHGVKHEKRTLGSVGTSWPERVLRGKKMPGRMGAERVTVKNLEVVKIDRENNIMAVKGAIPGRRGTLLEIKSSPC